MIVSYHIYSLSIRCIIYLDDQHGFPQRLTTSYVEPPSPVRAASSSSIILGPERMAAISAICHKTWRLPVLPCVRVGCPCFQTVTEVIFMLPT